jgi:hypothetical protein
MTARLLGRWAGVAAAVALAVGPAGCGGGTADVSGKVTYKGKPVTSGSVVFVGADGVAVAADIKPDGTYAATGVATGAVKVAVSSPNPAAAAAEPGGRGRGPAPAKPASPPAGWVALPAKYGSPDSSGLSTDLTPGPNTYDIPLAN